MSRSDSLQADVAIIGAGPAGSAAAILLARAGRRVILIDQKQFPREKVCGGCLSGSTVRRIRDLVGHDTELPGVAGDQISFVIGACRFTCHARGATRIVLRAELDEFLVRAAIAAGAQARFGERAALRPGTHGWEVLIAHECVLAKTILVAAGAGGLHRELGIRNLAGKRCLIGMQWIQPADSCSPPVGGVELHWLRGGYVGLATPQAGRCVVALAAEAPEYTGESAFQRLHRLNPHAPIWAIIPPDAPRRFGARGTAGFPWTPDRMGLDNLLLIGDAAGYEEPYTGEGIGLAIGSAACACRAVIEGGDVLRRYAALIRRHHRPAMRRTRWIAQFLATPAAQFFAARPAMVRQRWLSRAVEWIHVKGAH